MRANAPLHVHVSTLFMVLILVVGSLLGFVGYRMADRLISSVSADLAQRISRETSAELRLLTEPAHTALQLLQFDPLASLTQFEQRMARLPLIKATLDHTPASASIFFGYPTGDYFFVRRLHDAQEREQFQAPAGAHYMVRSIERQGATPRGRQLYLNSQMQVLSALSVPDYARGYDPRNRSWYRQALRNSEVHVTDPYLFYTDRQVGITLSRQSRHASGTVIGLDIQLRTLGAGMARQKLTPHSQLVLVNAQGEVFAHENSFIVPRGGSHDRPALTHLARFGVPVLTELSKHLQLSQVPATGSLQQVVSLPDGSWQVTLNSLPMLGSTPLLLINAVPRHELLATVYQEGRVAIIAALLIILGAIVLAWRFARGISRPLSGLVKEAESIRHFDFGQTVPLRSYVLEVNTLARTVGEMKRTIRQFLEISSAISGEKHFDRLLPRLLGETVSAVNAAAGVLYLREDGGLKPACAQGIDGQAIDAAALQRLHRLALPHPRDPAATTPTGQDVPLLGLALSQGRVLSGPLQPVDMLTLGLSELGEQPWPPHAMAVPLLNRQRDLVGAMLILSETPSEKDRASFLGALSGTAAVALEAQSLISEQKVLFDALIQLIANAIDTKSAYTGGHCARVPELTRMLAEAACEARESPYASFHLNDEGWETLRMAAWLHDCGKITTPEYVVDKATKLETLYNRIHEVRMRFEVLKRDAELHCLQGILEGGDEAACRQNLARTLTELDEDFAFVARCNLGSEAMAPEDQQRLLEVAQRTWQRTLDDRLGLSPLELQRHPQDVALPLPVTESVLADKPQHRMERPVHDLMPKDDRWGFRMAEPKLLYNQGELYNLRVSYGTLTEEERFKINQHIVQTEVMLRQLPFPPHLTHVPEIAAGHHEKMDGTGYPKGLHHEQLRPETRMLAIADIFEALTASDRPYKKPKKLSEAIEILNRMSQRGHIDPALFALFLSSGVYRVYAERFLDPSQIDDVPVTTYLAATDGTRLAQRADPAAARTLASSSA
ncbi:HD domain-containing phosphohydrolase [Aquabacterium sp.]|uniref:HD domain-containing phosphohydrolase n=1 Tax=Aquabacterium sp. TaxID=1872578 RepID=UPI003D0518E2